MAVHLGLVKKSCPLSIRETPMGKVGGHPLLLLEHPLQLECCGTPPLFIVQIFAPGTSSESYYRYIYVFQCVNCKRTHACRAQLPEGSTELQGKHNDWNDELSDIELLGNIAGAATAVLTDFTVEIIEENTQVTAIIQKLFESNVNDPAAALEILDLLEPEPLNVEENIEKESDEDDDDEGVLKELENKQKAQEDVSFEVMKWARDCEPSACIRYGRATAPLWYSDNNRPQVSVPPCECGAKRAFEFQVLPSALSCFKHLDLEFGTILVFTCTADCVSSEYSQEIAVCQPML